MIVANSNDLDTIMANRNTIAMILIMVVISGVVVWLMGITLSMVSLTAITMVGVVVRGIRMVVLTDVNILGMLLSA